MIQPSATQPAAAPPRVLANSVPKAGTHLLRRCLAVTPGFVDTRVHVDIALASGEIRARLGGLPEGGIATGHLIHTPEYEALLAECRVAHVMIVRDPRDVVVSYAEYAANAPIHYLHEHFRSLSPRERLAAAIRGVPGRVPWDDVALRDVAGVFAQFRPWGRVAGLRVVRFEDLVGPAGGGDAGAQRRAIADLTSHLGLSLSPSDVEDVAARVFDTGSPTFREGRIGGWRARFDSDHKAAMKEIAGGLLIELGYEPDLSW